MSAFKEAQKSMKQDMESGTLWQKHVSDDWEIKKIGPMSGSSKGVLLNYYFCHKKIPEAEKKTVRIVVSSWSLASHTVCRQQLT